MPKPQPENNYAFIDSQNLNLSIRELGWRLDFSRFRVWMRRRENIRISRNRFSLV